MFHVVRRVCDEVYVWDVFLLFHVCVWVFCCWHGCVVLVVVVGGLLLCFLPMVGGVGEIMWAHFCCMMLLTVYRHMLVVMVMPCCGLLMFYHSNVIGCGCCKRMYLDRRMKAPLSLVWGYG